MEGIRNYCKKTGNKPNIYIPRKKERIDREIAELSLFDEQSNKKTSSLLQAKRRRNR